MTRNRTAAFRLLLTALAVLLVLSTNLFAQYTSGRVQGSVSDPSGRLVHGAAVLLTNTETNVVRNATTNDEGVFAFPALPPGNYKLAVSATGFAKVALTFYSAAGETATENVTLKVSNTSATVDVTAAASEEIKIADAQLGVTRSAIETNDLPTLNRSVSNLVALEPGVQPMYTQERGALVKVSGAQTGLITANGGRPESSSVEIDFTDANDWEFGGIAVSDEPAPDLIQEYKVITSNASAEYGVKSSGYIQYVTKSGTNRWHGDAYNYLKNDALNARDYFDTTGKATRIDENNYGFSGGGPIIRNKTFLFGGWEQQKLKGGGFTTVADVPSAAARATVTNSTIAALINKYLPSATGSTSDPNIGTVTQQFSAPTNAYQFLIKGDQYFSESHHLSSRYFSTDGNQVLTFPSFNTLAGFDSLLHWEARNANITDTYVFSPASVNELRVGYSRSIATLPPQNGLVSPRFNIAGLVGFGALPYFPQGRLFNLYQVNDIYSHTVGRHLLKFGFDFRDIQDNSQNATLGNGYFDFGSLNQFLAGQPDLWEQAFGPTALGFRSKLFSAFAQDDFKLTPRLTLNAGLRWDYQGALSEAHGNISVLDPSLQGTAIGNAGTGALGAFRVGNPVIKANPLNFGPRVGFAWNPGGGKLAIRGGYGIYWDAFTFSALAQARSNAPEHYTFSLSGSNNITGGNSLDALLAGTSTIQRQANAQIGSFGSLKNFGSLTTLKRGLRNPYVQQYNLGLEYQLTRSTVASAAYVGSKSTHLGIDVPINSVANRPAGATSSADEQTRLSQFESVYDNESGAGNNRIDSRFNQVNLITDLAASNYNSLQLSLRHSLAYGLTLQGSYTWSKSIDNSSTQNPTQDSNDNGFPQNVNNLRAERAVSNFDVPHRFVLTSVWRVPLFASHQDLLSRILLKGWDFETINTFQSGVPGTALAGTRTVADGSGNSVSIADVNLDGNYIPNGDDNTRANASNVSGHLVYSQPLLGNDGTAGRNTLRLNHYLTFNWALQKEFKFAESGPGGSGPWALQFRTEAYNIFNNPYLRPSGDNWRTISSAGFGELNSAGPSRNLQLALRLLW